MNLVIFLIRSYQKLLSPIAAGLGAQCRFYPSCSEYSATTFAKHSFFKATYYVLKRLCKCSPRNSGGIDYVPPA